MQDDDGDVCAPGPCSAPPPVVLFPVVGSAVTNVEGKGSTARDNC